MKKTFYVLALFASAVAFASCSDAEATTPQETAAPTVAAAKPVSAPSLDQLNTVLANAKGAAQQAEEDYKIAQRAAALRYEIKRMQAVKRYYERKANALR